MKVKSESEVAQSCPALHYPMDCSPPGSSAHGSFQARVLEGGAIAFSGIYVYVYVYVYVYIYIYMCVCVFYIFFSIMIYDRILITVPCALQ